MLGKLGWAKGSVSEHPKPFVRRRAMSQVLLNAAAPLIRVGIGSPICDRVRALRDRACELGPEGACAMARKAIQG